MVCPFAEAGPVYMLALMTPSFWVGQQYSCEPTVLGANSRNFHDIMLMASVY